MSKRRVLAVRVGVGSPGLGGGVGFPKQYRPFQSGGIEFILGWFGTSKLAGSHGKKGRRDRMDLSASGIDGDKIRG